MLSHSARLSLEETSARARSLPSDWLGPEGWGNVLITLPDLTIQNGGIVEKPKVIISGGSHCKFLALVQKNIKRYVALDVSLYRRPPCTTYILITWVMRNTETANIEYVNDVSDDARRQEIYLVALF